MTLHIAQLKEFDLRQVGTRREICPQICILRLGQFAIDRSTNKLANGIWNFAGI